MKVAIRRVSLVSLGKVGCLLGVVAAFLPSLLCGLLGMGLLTLIAGWLESWQTLNINVLGQELASLDLLQFLGLDKVLGQVQAVVGVSAPVIFLVVLGLALLSGAFLALIVALVGLAYNLLSSATGGLVVEMEAVEEAVQAKAEPVEQVVPE